MTIPGIDHSGLDVLKHVKYSPSQPTVPVPKISSFIVQEHNITWGVMTTPALTTAD